jgi:hypothetical protein
MKKFAFILAVVFVSAGSADARVSGMSSLGMAHFPICSGGLVQRLCICSPGGKASTMHRQLCRVGWYCHPYDGVCRQ